ncbi:decapping endonuclease targeting mRNA [Rhizina undulata]
MSTHTFAVQPLERFAGASTALARPREITYFSYDEKRKLHLDTSSLRYYYPPELDNDLSQGFDTFGKHDDSIDEHLDGLLTAMIDLERRTGERCKADVVTWRGMITKVRI